MCAPIISKQNGVHLIVQCAQFLPIATGLAKAVGGEVGGWKLQLL